MFLWKKINLIHLLDPIQYDLWFLYTTSADPELEPKLRYWHQLRLHNVEFEAAPNAFKLLCLRPEIILTVSAFFLIGCSISPCSSIIALFASWKLLELLYIGLNTNCIELSPQPLFRTYVNRAAPATLDAKRANTKTFWADSKYVKNKMENLNAFWASA